MVTYLLIKYVYLPETYLFYVFHDVKNAFEIYLYLEKFF